MNRSPPKPRFAVFPATLFAVGLGMVFYYGDLWHSLPPYSPAEIEQSAERNLLLDLRRQGPAALATLDEPQLQALREQALQQVQAKIARERRDCQRGVATGAVLTAFGLLQMWLIRRAAQRQLVAVNRARP